jgi:lipoate-protein ligase A
MHSHFISSFTFTRSSLIQGPRMKSIITTLMRSMRPSASPSRCFTSLIPRHLRVLDLTMTSGMSLYSQLSIEEGIFRCDHSTNCWLLINRLPPPHNEIVLGASGRPELWVNLSSCFTDKIPLLKRFSGGGTVFTDHNTIFLSFIFSAAAFTQIQLFPKPTLQLIADLYARVFNSSSFSSLPFQFLGNDFCFGSLKFVGNAQSITKQRFLTHSTVLWDYSAELMDRYILLPTRKKQPEYRQNRNHKAFLTTLKQNWSHQQKSLIDAHQRPESLLLNQFIKILHEDYGFSIEHVNVQQAIKVIDKTSYKSSLSFIEITEEMIKIQEEQRLNKDQ